GPGGTRSDLASGAAWPAPSAHCGITCGIADCRGSGTMGCPPRGGRGGLSRPRSKSGPHPGPLPQAGEGTLIGDTMPQPLRIALAQFDFPVGAVEENASRIVELIAEARDGFGADLILFPELALSGYPPEDLLLRPSFLRDCDQAMARIATAATGITAVVGWPETSGSVVYNAASILRDGRI